MQKATPRHTVPVSQVHNILNGARSQGLDVNTLLARAGIPPVLLSSGLSRVSQTQYSALLRVLQRRMRDEFWGLCSHPVKLGTFAQCCELAVHAPTLGGALRAGAHFYHLILQDFTVRLQRSGDLVWVRAESHSKDHRRHRFAEMTFVFFSFGLASWLIEERLPVRQVSIVAPKHESGPSLASLLFNSPVSYEQPFNGFAFDARWLDCAIRQDSASLHRFLRRSPGDLICRYRDRSRISERVRCYLRQHLAEGSIPVEKVADALGVTPYTLRRRLRMENERYQELKDDLRRDAAIEYLNCPNLSLTEVGERLGFSEPSTFHRAFKKWTGLPPGEYRDVVLADEPMLLNSALSMA